MALRGGRYETLRPIASGGMARVYLGRALGAGGFERLVAIKAMHGHLAEQQDFVDMFLDEARLAARIRHPNVVGTFDVQQDEEGAFLVMEYVEGPSLGAMLRALRRDRRALPRDVAARVFLDALAGLHAAHELTGPGGEPLHLVHRDVSPQNVLAGADGISRLTDFGVARAAARLSSTRDGQVKGKVGYMAPEQLHNQPVDRRTDVYAAGVVLWEMLAGESLVRGDSEGAVLAAALAPEKRSPRDVDPTVPEPLAAVTMRALARRADDRYASASDFADALESAALASGITIASPRAVAAFVKALGAHKAPGDLPASLLSVGAAGPIERGLTPAGTIPTAAVIDALPIAPEGASTQASALVASVSPSAPARPVRVIVAAAIAVAAGGVIAILALRGGPAPPPAPAGAKDPAAAASSAPAPIVGAQTNSGSSAGAPSASASSAAVSPSASASTRPAAARPGRPAGAPAPPPGATSFRPREL